MKKHIRYIALAGTAAAGMLAACQPDTVCRQENEIECSVHCVDTLGNTVQDTAFALRADVTEMCVPLRCDSLTDTLRIGYTNEFRYVSMACGNFIFHQIDTVEVWGEVEASAVINEKRVENVTAQHVVVTVK